VGDPRSSASCAGRPSLWPSSSEVQRQLAEDPGLEQVERIAGTLRQRADRLELWRSRTTGRSVFLRAITSAGWTSSQASTDSRQEPLAHNEPTSAFCCVERASGPPSPFHARQCLADADVLVEDTWTEGAERGLDRGAASDVAEAYCLHCAQANYRERSPRRRRVTLCRVGASLIDVARRHGATARGRPPAGGRP
jgi:hypothetical protein